MTTQHSKIKQIVILIILVILVITFIILINKLVFSQTTVNFQPIQNSSIELLSTNSHYSLTVNTSSKKRIPKGSYTVIYLLHNQNYQVVSQIININHSLTLSLPLSAFPYSQQYLSTLLINQQTNLKKAFLSSSFAQLLNNNQYNFEPVKLFGNSGQWAFIRLVPNNLLADPSLLTIMEQNKNSWTVLIKPSIYLTKYNIPTIPLNYLDELNQIDSTLSNINSQTTSQLVDLASHYIQQYENRDSSYQSSPSSWLTSLNNDLTNSFLNYLESQFGNTIGSAGTGILSSDYQINHQDNYSIVTKINNCLVQQLNSNSYSVACNFTNQVVSSKTKQSIPKQSIPFGYTLNAQQNGITINIINQNNQYQINSASGV